MHTYHHILSRSLYQATNTPYQLRIELVWSLSSIKLEAQ